MENNGLLQGVCESTRKAIRVTNWPNGAFFGIQISNKGTTFFIEECYEEKFAQKWNGQGLLQLLRYRINGTKFNKSRTKLVVPASDKAALIIHHFSKSGRLKFSDKASFEAYQTLLLKWQVYYGAARLQAQYKQNKELNNLAQNFPSPKGIVIGGHQRAAASCAISVPGYGFFMEQGSGKTFPAIMTMEHLARNFREQQIKKRAKDPEFVVKPFHTLIIAPKNVCTNWITELNRFTCERGKIVNLRGDKITRIKLIIDLAISPNAIDDPQFGYLWTACIMSYGLLTRDLAKLRYLDWGLCVADESHFIKNSNADRTKAAMALRECTKRRLVMTGTPMPNGPGDLYSQLEFMEKGNSGFPTRDKFKSAYMEVNHIKDSKGGISITKFSGVANMNELQEKLSCTSFSITKAEALPGLPPKTYDIIDVEMTDEQAKFYKSALQHVVVECESSIAETEGDAKKSAMILQNVLKKMLRLSQITSGFYVTDDVCDDDGNVLVPGETNRFDPNPKVEALIEFLKSKGPYSKTIIWSNWIQDIKTISARMVYERVDHVVFYGATSNTKREEAIYRFNNDEKCKVFLGNPTAGGVGINLLGHSSDKTNCDGVAYFCQDWSSSTRAQSEDRPHRKGTRTHVQITDFVVANTIDQKIREAVLQKRIVSNNVSNLTHLMKELVKAIN